MMRRGIDHHPTDGGRCSPRTGQMVVMSYLQSSIDVMTITSVNEGLSTEDITSVSSGDRGRRNVDGTERT